MEELLDRIAREAARKPMTVDLPVYEAAGRDPLEPVLLGSGSLEAELGFFGRDPGRREAETGEPFIGKGGQLVRGALYRAAGGRGEPSLEESVEIGKRVFWGNTVPYKPIGNKKRQF
jgi:uracil-DNA glycosylase